MNLITLSTIFLPSLVYADDSSTLSSSLNTSSSSLSFGTILVAVITPLLLIAIAYLIIKMTKK